MPFALTCPGCGATFRSARERPIGKGVECPKCGTQFYVSAENQEEVRADRRRERDADRPARRREDDREDTPVGRRRDRDDGPRPTRRRGSRRVLVLLAVAGLVLLLVGGGLAAYFLVPRGGGGSAEDKVRPPRELPPELFVHMPGPKAEVTYVDLERVRGAGGDSAAPEAEIVKALPPAAGIAGGQVRAYAIWKGSFAYGGFGTTPDVMTVALAGPIDVAQLAARCKYEPFAEGPKGTYTNTDKGPPAVLFRPDPQTVVFARAAIGQGDVSRKSLAQFADRTPQNYQLPPELLEGLKAVSGYPKITAYAIRHGVRYEPIASFRGSDTVPGQYEERYEYSVFASPKAARDWFNTMLSGGKARSPDAIEQHKWIKDDRIYRFERIKK